MSPILTIFTPTHNRAYTLHLCYESLKRQTCKDFIWLIIDDGSKDNTKKLVADWKEENIVPIQYYFQENQGMHGAHNTAYDLIKTELNVCIDSDDYMSDNAVEKIIKFWKENGDADYAGIVGLDANQRGDIIGTNLPSTIKASTLTELYEKHQIKGDKKLVFRTELTKITPPYPLFPGEKYCPLSYKYILIDQIQPLLIMNEVLCHVEYLPDGSSLNMFNQYRKNPMGFSFFRKELMKLPFGGRIYKFKQAAHYVSSNLLMKNWKLFMETPKKMLTFFAFPFGFLLYIVIISKTRTV